MDAMNEPLLGVRVIDFGQYVAGPLAAMLLGDHGAEVIRIDPPGGPRLVTPANATWQRGKQSRVLDLQHDADRATAQQLIASADVVIENFRPGVMDRHGIGAAAMRAAHPGLIYCSLPGFATDDPRAGLAAWEGVVGAATDTYRRSVGSTGVGSTNSGSDQPVYVGIPIASNFAAFQAANAITAALIARQRNGLGQRIEVPLFDAMFTAIGARAMRVPNSLDPILDNIGFGVYVCADGRCVHFAPVAPRFMDWFVDAVGIAAWRAEGLFERARLNTDPALVAELRRRLTLLFAQRTALDWETLGDTIGVPIAVCRSMTEWAHTEHAGASGTIVELDDPQHGRMRLPGAAVRLSGPPERALVARRPLDADRDSGGFVRPRAAAGSTPKSSTPPSTTPATPATSALAGLRVLDLTQIWAGPTAGRALAEYGADVIKINSPHEPVMTHVDVNRGKRTVLLDLAAPQDLAVFWRLLDTADVVMQNFRFGAAERLGVGYEQVRARRPDIIYASISAYGSGGPWRARRGYEVQGQAVAGAQDQFGGDAAAQRLPYEINDYGTGVLGAFAVLLAQHHRLRTGEGQHVEAALTYTATLHQSMHLQDFVGKEWTEPRGQSALGSGPLQRLYRANDGWFFLGARESELAALARIDGLAGIAELRDEQLALSLEHAVLTRPVAHWVERFNAAGAGAHALIPVQQLIDDAWVRAHGLVITREHVGVGSVTTTGPVARLSGTPLRPGHPVLPPGADLAEVLRELELHELGRRESSSPAPAH